MLNQSLSPDHIVLPSAACASNVTADKFDILRPNNISPRQEKKTGRLGTSFQLQDNVIQESEMMKISIFLSKIKGKHQARLVSALLFSLHKLIFS
jgi:hypothetical protein